MDGAAPEVWSGLGHALALTGRPDEARKIINQLAQHPGYGWVFPYHYAVINAGLGETDPAFAYLDKENREDSYNLIYVKTDPKLDSLRADARFAELLRQLRLDR